MKRLAIISTHPIQYYAPVFRLLHQRQNISIHVFYTWGETVLQKHDPGFGHKVEWDIPLLEGYPFSWMENKANNPGSHHFYGIKNPELISAIKNYQPDAVLIFGWAYKSHLKAMRYFKGKIPVFFRGDSTLLDNISLLKSVLRQLLLRWVYTHVAHAFYVGKNNKAYFKKHGLKEHQLSFAPHAIDNSRFSVDHMAASNKIRAKMDIPQSAAVLLFAGKFEHKKDPLLLLDAFGQIDNTNVHLVFAGSGVLKDELKVKSQKLKANIHFMPFQNQTEMPALYQLCDVFCLPSKGPGETWGLAVNEAMASCKAVVVSGKTGCAADLLLDGKNGYIFKAGNVAELATKISLLISNKQKMKEFGEESRRKIQSWNFEAVAYAFEEKVNAL